MKPLLLILPLMCLFTLNLSGQRLPFFMPEDVESTTLNVKCYCSPGVEYKSRSRGLELSFTRNTSADLRAEDGSNLSFPFSSRSINYYKFSLRYPVINKDNLKIIAGIIYKPEQFRFRSIGSEFSPVFAKLNEVNLKSSGFEAIIVKPINEKIYTTFRVRSIFNGDYNGLINFDSRFAVYNFSAAIGFKTSKWREWAIGLNYSDSFRRSILLPFLIYNHTFNEKWGIESVLPALLNVRYNVSPKTILLTGLRFASSSYSLRLDDGISNEIFALNHSEIKFTVNVEQKLSSWFWVDFALGYQYNFNTDFEAQLDANDSFQVRPKSSPFFKIGIFLSPPDDFLK